MLVSPGFCSDLDGFELRSADVVAEETQIYPPRSKVFLNYAGDLKFESLCLQGSKLK